MLKHAALTAALVAVAFTDTPHRRANAFQSARPVALARLGKQEAPLVNAADITSTQLYSHKTSHVMTMADRRGPLHSKSLFRTISRNISRTRQKLRRSVTVILASFAIFLSLTRILPAPPAHATSTITATTSVSSLSLAQKLNPFRTRSADEMIDAYVRQKLFADDEYDPVESAYREAFADFAGSAGGQAVVASSGKVAGDGLGAYPTVLAETAGAALGQSKSVADVLSSATTRGVGTSAANGNGDGLISAIVRCSDFLQSRLRVSAKVSYYILVGATLSGVIVVPTLVGVFYDGYQRIQIEKSEMKTYGMLSDVDATSNEEGGDDDDDDEEE